MDKDRPIDADFRQHDEDLRYDKRVMESVVIIFRTGSILLLTTVATLALAACQKPAEAPVANNATATDAIENTVSANAMNAAPSANAIPTAFLGRWGMVPNDCDVSRSDTKGLVTVSPDSLKFYESMGRLETIDIVSPTEVKATFAFTGEGQNWTKAMTLSLDEGGTTLVRMESDPSGSFRHKKCA